MTVVFSVRRHNRSCYSIFHLLIKFLIKPWVFLSPCESAFFTKMPYSLYLAIGSLLYDWRAEGTDFSRDGAPGWSNSKEICQF
jgi:hypothetical protein